jgi:hypothetical protein
MKNEIAEVETKVTDNPFYLVTQERLHLPDGTPTPFYGNVRKDTGVCLKAVTERYSLIQNSELIERAESIFASKGMRFTRKVDVTQDGARMFANYTFDNHGFKVQKDDFKFKLSLRNSFDGSMKVSLVVGLFRVVCSNGASVMETGIDLMRKHTASLDIEFASGAVDNALAVFNRQSEVLDILSRTKLNQNEGHQVLNGLVKRSVLADRVADKVREIWEKPTYEEDRQRSVYNLWNAITEHTTHDIAGTRKKVELATRLNTDATRTLFDFTRQGRISDLFVKELQKNN